MTRYTNNGTAFVHAGGSLVHEGVSFMCVTAEWLLSNGYGEYKEIADDGEDGLVDGVWYHYKGKPYVAPTPVPEPPHVPTEEEIAAEQERQRVYNIQMQIESLKQQLSSTDYKVIKCAECQLAGVESPYDINEVHAERQSIRDQINELEEQLNPIPSTDDVSTGEK